MVYYNEIDPFCRAWLRALMRAGQIPNGYIDPRPIQRVTPEDLVGYDQHHFFAGIGGWPYALRLVGWPDDRPIWTGSCPCQPFSSSGKRRGFKDERHLWPYWRWLLAHARGESRPPIVVGEQVASKAGRAWLDAVRADVEDLAFAFGATDLCAAGEGAPHIRQRLFFAAIDADRLADRRPRGWRARRAGEARAGAESSCGSRAARERLDDTYAEGRERPRLLLQQRQSRQDQPDARRAIADRGLGHTDRARRREDAERARCDEDSHGRRTIGRHESPGAGEDDSPWAACEWIPCLDGKLRPVEPGTRPLATGVPGRVGKLRGYGNSIVPQVAATFLDTVMELID